jgi:hypothetical protein
MKFSKFNRQRYEDPCRKYRISRAKTEYLNSRGKSRILDSLYPENQTWGALHKAWKGLIVGKKLCQTQRARYYAKVIQKLQNELGLPISSFPDLNVFPLEGERYSQEEIDRYYNVEYVSDQDMKEWYE